MSDKAKRMRRRRNAREALIAKLLVLGEGFTGQGGLIDRDVDGVRETGIGGDNVSDFERDHISGNQVRRFDFAPRARALDLGLGCE